ncbi:MAG: NADH-quinone oxidoreductase subunit L [Deltaproteobacteria bacterium]|nr:NADH-quinone oxidoreductase subunit L [Deltaproteobacteria bacterium]
MNGYLVDFCLIIALLPLTAFVIQAFFGRKLPRGGDWVSLGAIFTSLALSVWVFASLFAQYDPAAHLTKQLLWIDTGELLGRRFVISMGILLDNLSSIMLVVVALISSLVQLFSVGYMHGDPRYSRYFAYLSLFSFAMLALVLTDNVFGLYMSWELVGLGSYLLIGFWYEKKAAANAATKAFITTRVGDIGMFLGVLTIVYVMGGVGYDDIFRAAGEGRFTGNIWGIPLLTVAGIGLFMGAVGKSAQFPLHVWLPDAMEGPTPVSALIHAATMVAAGVYLVARMFPFFDGNTLIVIAYTGGFTALFAATIALVQTDIKKVLAYSTISQLGYMMLGLGVGAYTAGFMHLVTHASFKACLFLCSGSVIHAVHTQDMREMGGLRRKMPVTFIVCLIATLAISGIPFFSGFLSKDAILAGVLGFAEQAGHHWFLPLFGFTAAALTAFYMFRLIFMTFLGKPADLKKWDHAHEAPWTMLLPTIVLAALSFSVWYGGSLTGIEPGFLLGSFNNWFEHLIQKPELILEGIGGGLPLHFHTVHVSHEIHQLTMILSISVALLGILGAWVVYGKGWVRPERIAAAFSAFYRTFANLYYVDSFYQRGLVGNVIRLNNSLANFDNRVIDSAIVDGSGRVTVLAAHESGDFDNIVVDGSVDAIGSGFGIAGGQLRRIQTGRIQQYMMVALSALVLMALIYGWIAFTGE